jgi:hypothetical protein
MEQAIDAGTQSIVKDDNAAVLEEAALIITDVQQSVYPVDMYMWNTRFAPRYGALPPQRIDTNGRLTQLNRIRGEHTQGFRYLAAQWAQENCRPDPVIHALGLRRFRQARQILMQCRVNMVNMQMPGTQSLQVEHWKIVHGPVFETLDSFPNDHDRFDFIIALWSASLKTPTSSGQRITDQIVMNPDVFPILLDALRFYGLARYITLTEEGNLTTYKVDEWDLECVQCGSVATTNSPRELQWYYHINCTCRTCRESNEQSDSSSQATGAGE